MNKKLHCLYVMADHAIGREQALDSVALAGLADIKVAEASVYLGLLRREGSIQRRPGGLRVTKNGKRRPTWLYWIPQQADVEAILRKSEAVSARAGVQKPAPRFTAVALAQRW